MVAFFTKKMIPRGKEKEMLVSFKGSTIWLQRKLDTYYNVKILGLRSFDLGPTFTKQQRIWLSLTRAKL